MFRVLVVDDSKVIHSFIKTVLRDGYEISSAFDGVEAIEFLEKNSSVDLVLLDWEMPNKNGIETLEEVMDRGFDVPVIMFTTRNNPEDLARALGLGAEDYLMKPITEEILKEKIEALR